MEYRTAKSIRGRSLSSMITERIVTGGGVGSSIKKAISQKMKAKVTGIKERFDPMNIAKFLTGGSNLAPAIVGRLTGRKKSDIDYFTGRGKRTATRIGGTGQLGKIGDGSSMDSIKSLFTLIKKSHEEDMKLRETERTFREERVNEEDRRHQEFLNALKEYTGASATIIAPGKEKGGGLLDFLKRIIGNTLREIRALISAAIAGVMKFFSWVSNLRVLSSIAPALAKFFATKLGLSLLGLTSVAGLAGLLYYMIRSDTPPGEETAATAGLTPTEDAMQTAGFVPSKRFTPENVQTMADERSVVNRMEDFKKKMRNMKAFGRSEEMLDKYLDEYAQSSDPVDSEAAKRLIAQRQETRFGAKEKFRRSEIEKQNYGISPMPMSAPSATGVVNSSSSIPMTPVMSTPSSSPVYSSSADNINLNMSQSMGEGSAQPVITNSVTNTSTDQPMPATASTRDDTEIVERIFRQSISPF